MGHNMMNYNGVDLLTAVPGLAITEIGGRGPISQDLNTIKVPGRPGTYFVDKETPARVIPVTFELTGSSLADLRTKMDQFNNILNVAAPVPIVFNDESNKTYYGLPSGQTDWKEKLFRGTGTINFYCADPNKYSPINTSSTYTESTTITNNGNQVAEPITTIVLKADTSYISLYNSTTDKMNLLGMPTKPGETQTDAETLVIFEQFTTTTGWTAPASTEDGTVSGAMQVVGGYQFQASDYGTGTGWHGPALKKSLPSTVQDFKQDFYFSMSNNGNNSAGGIVFSLLDGQNNVVLKVSCYKHYPGMAAYYLRIRVGKTSNGYDAILDSPIKLSAISMMFRVKRLGADWTFEVYWKTNGKYVPLNIAGVNKYWKDTNSISTAQATQLQIQIMQRDTTTACFQGADDASIWRLNTLTAGQIPYVAKNGDTIVFDHKTNIITRNGVDVSKDKAFIGEYFGLVPGNNVLIAEPYDVFTSVQTKWQDKWQ